MPASPSFSMARGEFMNSYLSVPWNGSIPTNFFLTPSYWKGAAASFLQLLWDCLPGSCQGSLFWISYNCIIYGQLGDLLRLKHSKLCSWFGAICVTTFVSHFLLFPLIAYFSYSEKGNYLVNNMCLAWERFFVLLERKSFHCWLQNNNTWMETTGHVAAGRHFDWAVEMPIHWPTEMLKGQNLH